MAAQIAAVAGYGLARPGGLEVAGPRYLPVGAEILLEPARADLFAEGAERAAAAIGALFDPAAGGHDGKGWPLGRLPDSSDIAAVLGAIESFVLPTKITLFRVDRQSGNRSELPESIPSDVLVRLDPASLTFERATEAES